MNDDTEQPEQPEPPSPPEAQVPTEVPAATDPAAPGASTPPPPPVHPDWPPPTVGATDPIETTQPSTESNDPTEPTEPTADPTPHITAPVMAATPYPGTGYPTPPPPPPPTAPGGGTSKRPWIAVAVVAALIGAGVGTGVTELVNNNGNDNSVTIHESNATAGAAILSGNVTIPELVKKVIPAVVSIDVKSNGAEDQGTGMIITSGGEVITNNHVIEAYTQGGNTGSITVTEYGQAKPNPTTLIGYDTKNDVALLKINNASNLPTVTLGNNAKTQVGDAVVAIGNALGLAAGTPTVTQGIISALGRSVTAGGTGTQSETLQNLIQTDAAINPGNSGGPLIDTAGQVIGMNTAVAGTSSDGTSAQNIGFAIPIASVIQLIGQLEKGGPPSNSAGYLGVDITTLTPALRQQYGFTPTKGAVIVNVLSGSPADKAGLVKQDVIVAVNNTTVASAQDLETAIQNSQAGQSVQLTYYVGNIKHTTSVTLGTQAEAQQQQAQQQTPTPATPFGG
jgi:S1-C subfamily serine protease